MPSFFKLSICTVDDSKHLDVLPGMNAGDSYCAQQPVVQVTEVHVG